jgi:hypothetical protein
MSTKTIERTKRVRFSDASNRLPYTTGSESTIDKSPSWCSTPSTPSLTFSSLPSTPDNNHLQVNPFLSVGASPGITFNVALQPLESFAPSMMPGSTPVNTSATRNLLLCEPVTSPPTQSLILLTDLLPWYIKVEPSLFAASSHAHPQFHLKIPSSRSTLHRPFVTLADLLSGIFDTLQRPVTTTEFYSLALHTQTLVAAQFYRRLDKINDAREMNKVKSQGVIRADVLLGKTLFVGLGVLEDGNCPSLSLHLK